MESERCYCNDIDCECTINSHAMETETNTNDGQYHCTDHWMRVAYEKTTQKVTWKQWRTMVNQTMEDLLEYFWNYTTLEEYKGVWEEELQELAENDYPTECERDRSQQLHDYLERLKELVAAGFNPKHSYDADEGLWMWA